MNEDRLIGLGLIFAGAYAIVRVFNIDVLMYVSVACISVGILWAILKVVLNHYLDKMIVELARIEKNGDKK